MIPFTLALALTFFSSGILAQEKRDCAKFHQGTFASADEEKNFTVYRNETHQIEYNLKTNEWVTVELTWVSDCKYSFIYISTNMARLEHLIGYKMVVTIVETNNSGYKFVATVKATNEVIEGEMVLLPSKLNCFQLRKIKRKLKKTQ